MCCAGRCSITTVGVCEMGNKAETPVCSVSVTCQDGGLHVSCFAFRVKQQRVLIHHSLFVPYK